MPYEKGTKIRVDITGRVIENQIGESAPVGSLLSTTYEVEETATGWFQFLYLNSDSVTGDKRVGGTVTARFDAVITGPVAGSKTSTTEVRELRNGVDYGYTHYIFLNSSSVTVLEETSAEPASQPEPEPVPASQPVPAPAQKDVGGDRITPKAVEIESADILKRIAELEDAAPAAFRLVRNRSGGQLTPVFPSRFTALTYLDEEDLNPERFTVKEVKGEFIGDDQVELNELRKLNDAGRSQFGSTQWITAGVLLRRDEDCDEDWAQDQARAELGVPYVDIWPLSLIDWSEAARDLLESDYLSVVFDGTTYWGKYTG